MKFIKENFDRSTDLERRIANYRANSHKIISESLDPKLVELAKKYDVQVEEFNDNIRVLGKNSDINSFYKEYLKFTGLDSDEPSSELDEDVKKLPNGKWANVGKDGKADSGKFDTKKEAEAQRKAMYANGYKDESLEESVNESSTKEDNYTIWIFDEDSNNWETWGTTDKPYIHPEIGAVFGERVKVLPLGESPKLEEDVEIEIETKDEPKIEVEDSDEHSIENVPDMPQTDCKMIIANLLNPLIKDELEAIDGYNSAVATIRSMMEDETTDKSVDYEGIIAVISEITNEENLHIGQLEKLLETVSPNAKSINDGKDEAAEQLEETSNNEEVEIEKDIEKEEEVKTEE